MSVPLHIQIVRSNKTSQ